MSVEEDEVMLQAQSRWGERHGLWHRVAHL